MKKAPMTAVLTFLLLFGITGCSAPIERISTAKDDSYVEFETLYKVVKLYDNDNYFGYTCYGYKHPENTIIDTEEQLQIFFDNSGLYFDSSDIDFNEYMIFVDSRACRGNTGLYNIIKISNNDNTLDILFESDDSDENDSIYPPEGMYAVSFNISKIKKCDFPYEPRDYLSHVHHP